MKIRPLQDRLIVKHNPAAEKIGSLFVPDNAKEKPLEGEVLAVGAKCVNVKAGDVIVFTKYAGTELKHEDATVLFLREEDVLGVLEP